MKKPLLITLALLILVGGPALYFLSSPERQVVETFSSFGFKNDPVERSKTAEGEDWYGGELGEPEGVTEGENNPDGQDDGDWYTNKFGENGAGEASSDGTSNSSGGTQTDGGIGGEAEGGGADGDSETSLAYTPSQTTSNTSGSSGGTTNNTNTGTTGNTGSTGSTGTTSATTPPSYTLTITSPTAGSVLSNKTCTTGTATACTERPIATIFWTYGDPTAKITIELHSRNGLARTLATKTSNSGRYTWDPSATLQDGDYKLILRAYSATGILRTSAETGYFEVSKTEDPSIETPEERDPVATTPRTLSRDYIGVQPWLPCPWGEPVGPCRYQGQLMSEAYPPPNSNGFQEMNIGDVPYYNQTNHRPLYLGGGKKWALRFRGDTIVPSFGVTFGAGTVGALMVPLEMFVSISRTKGDFDVPPGCLVTPAGLTNASAGGVEHGFARIDVVWKGGSYDREPYNNNGALCVLEPNGYYYVNVAGTCSEYWDPQRAYPGWQNDCPTVITNVNGWMTYLDPNYVSP